MCQNNGEKGEAGPRCGCIRQDAKLKSELNQKKLKQGYSMTMKTWKETEQANPNKGRHTVVRKTKSKGDRDWEHGMDTTRNTDLDLAKNTDDGTSWHEDSNKT